MPAQKTQVSDEKAKPSAEDQDLDFLFPVYVPKSFVWTVKNKYPRTSHNVDFRDWSKSMVREDENMYMKTRRPFFPLLPHERFMPLAPELSEEKKTHIRLNMDNPQGRKTPGEAIHIGFRKYSLDPSAKNLRHFNDPIPSPLVTTKRASYTDPADKPDLRFKLDTTRYALTPRHIALGIVPCTLSISPIPIKDTSASKDYVYKPRVDKRKKMIRHAKQLLQLNMYLSQSRDDFLLIS